MDNLPTLEETLKVLETREQLQIGPAPETKLYEQWMVSKLFRSRKNYEPWNGLSMNVIKDLRVIESYVRKHYAKSSQIVAFARVVNEYLKYYEEYYRDCAINVVNVNYPGTWEYFYSPLYVDFPNFDMKGKCDQGHDHWNGGACKHCPPAPTDEELAAFEV